MSPKSINKALDFLGEDYDLPLQMWKENSTKFLKKSCELARERSVWETRKEELDQLSAAGQDVVDGVIAVVASLSILQDEEKDLQENRPCSYSIVLDNVDLKLLASDMT